MGAVLSAIEKNKKLMEEHSYRTIGEMLYKDQAFRTECRWNEKGYVLTPRNKQGDYKHTILRALLEEEVKYIFHQQRNLGNVKATKELEESYLSIMLSQRSFDMGPGNQADGSTSPYAMEGFGERVGLCALEPRENQQPRGAKAAYTSEMFVALQKIIHLRLVKKGGDSRGLTTEERQVIIELLHKQKEVKYAAVRKALNLSNDDKFNTLNYSGKEESEEEKIKKTENTKFISIPNYQEYKKKMSKMSQQFQFPLEEQTIILLDKIGTILTLYKNDDTRTRELQKLDLEPEIIEELSKQKNDPEWMKEFRLKALEVYNKLELPTYSNMFH